MKISVNNINIYLYLNVFIVTHLEFPISQLKYSNIDNTGVDDKESHEGNITFYFCTTFCDMCKALLYL